MTMTAFCPWMCSVVSTGWSVICGPSNLDGTQPAWAILALRVKRLRSAWPSVRIILRVDSGFGRWRMLRWGDRHQVDYLSGVAQNRRPNALAQPQLAYAEQLYQVSQCKRRLFSEVHSAAQTWDRPHRVLIKAEHGPKGSNPCYMSRTYPANRRSYTGSATMPGATWKTGSGNSNWTY